MCALWPYTPTPMIVFVYVNKLKGYYIYYPYEIQCEDVCHTPWWAYIKQRQQNKTF